MNSEATEGLSTRLRKCAEIVGSGDELSRKTAIPRSTLESYLTGDSEPKASRLAAIAAAADVSLDWLVFGRGPMRPDSGAPQVAIIDGGISGTSTHLGEAPPLVDGITAAHGSHGTAIAPLYLDEALMGRLVDGITAAYKDHGAAIAPLHLGQLAARLHNEVVAVAEGPEDYPGAVKMRLAQLRKELQNAASDPTSSKRQA